VRPLSVLLAAADATTRKLSSENSIGLRGRRAG
jgi:hypothetical protein